MARLISERLAPSADLLLQTASDRLGLHRLYFDSRERLRARVERRSLASYRKSGLLFIHVPKCGGSSVEKQTGILHGHRSAVYFREADSQGFAEIHKATLVRNPYDRLVSAFHYLKNHTKSERDQAWARSVLGRIDGFPAFLSALEDRGFRRRVLNWLHFLPQWYFVCDRHGRILVDHVGRLEAFDAFAAQIGSRTGLAIANIREKKSARDETASYYDARGRRLVREIYERDFAIFGYSPDELEKR